MELKQDKKLFALGGVVLLAVLAVFFIFPPSHTTGNSILTTTTMAAPANITQNYCGNGVCDPGENCQNCPMDCDCVQLKLSKSITYDQFLIWCSADIKYAAINIGNKDASGVRLEMKTEVTYLNATRDSKDISLGNFPVNMTPVMGEEKLNYDCGDNIVTLTLRLYDADGHEFLAKEEKR